MCIYIIYMLTKYKYDIYQILIYPQKHIEYFCIYIYIHIQIHVYTTPSLLRTWAGCLYESISKDDKKKITEKARALDKQMVKVSINKQGDKKVVTEPQLLVCIYYAKKTVTSLLD